MYHRIFDAALDPWGICVSPANFSAQLAAIRGIATPISLEAFSHGQKHGGLDERSVVVTFDDGYLDNFQQALPILRQHQVPATVFVTTGNIDTRREFWWDRLESVLLQIGELPPAMRLRLPTGVLEWTLGEAAVFTRQQQREQRATPAWSAAPATRLRFFHEVWSAIRPLTDDERDRAIDAIASWAGLSGAGDGTRRTMSSNELAAMANDPLMTIGAHTVNHALLPAHPGHVQTAQIRDSQARLHDIVGRPIDSFDYPHGEHSPATVELLRAAGFERAVTVKQKVAGPGTDAMLLPRFGVKDVGGDALIGNVEAWFENEPA
jgi:peptidoglycan/xylan/chitin deacetylase (PgdA/CDA1 family)